MQSKSCCRDFKYYLYFLQHYQLDQENVQYLALRLSSKARSIYCELRHTLHTSVRNGAGSAEEDNGNEDGEGAERREAEKRQERVSTAVIAGVAEVLGAVKGLVCWLNRRVSQVKVVVLLMILLGDWGYCCQ